MSKLVFKLNHVPEDEAQDIRELLDEHQIEFYETDSGRWGLGFAAIWLKNEQDYKKASDLIEAYQLERSESLQKELQEKKAAGLQISKFEAFKQTPIRSSLLLIFAALLAYFTVIPFFQ